MKIGKKGKKALKIVLGIFCALMALILVVGALNIMYYPRYKESTEQFDISAVDHGEEIYIMSANVRTWSPTDVAKKSWFYRADLIVKNVEQATPDIIGFQEVTPTHYKFLTNALKGYDNILTYRDESPLPEACPIFYNA